IYSLESVFLSFTTFSLLLSCPPKFPFFPYTTLFRSESCCQCTSLPLPCPWESPLLSDWLRAQGHPAQQMASARNSRQTLPTAMRSEEHTTELQSRGHVVCRHLLEKKKHDMIFPDQIC